MANQVVWFDIPVRDVDRAIKFYSAVLGKQVSKQQFPGGSMGVLPHEEGEVSGCLAQCDGQSSSPSAQGPLIYLNCEGRLDEAEAAVRPNGGTVLQSKHAIGPYGFRSLVLDTEGNRVALHSM